MSLYQLAILLASINAVLAGTFYLNEVDTQLLGVFDSFSQQVVGKVSTV